MAAILAVLVALVGAPLPAADGGPVARADLVVVERPAPRCRIGPGAHCPGEPLLLINGVPWEWPAALLDGLDAQAPPPVR